ncbi:CG11092 [Drosophila busckii]|uniref:Nuclear pore protein n=1 Tax=Drosophila busckii TaxID=30019 RepID=A0A0M4ERG9_DROBS|nr:nuclear pore complex protein Nup93-1 [Drosophila busckii]ALC48727.1 CG11092 [Drosophila busckii]
MDLNELLQQAQRLTNETKMDVELPRVERTLSQVLQATQELHSRVTQTGTNDLQAHILLGSRGVDLPKLAQKLELLSARKSFEPLNPIADTDVLGYLKNERENAIIAVIEETNRNIFKTVERNKIRSIFAEWGDEKERLLNALVGPDHDDFGAVHRQMVPTVLPQIPHPRSRLSRMETLYAKEISFYNQQQSSNQRAGLLNKLNLLVKTDTDEFDVTISEMWAVLAYMSNVAPVSRNVEPIKSRQSGHKFAQQARQYLEQRYKEYMKTIIQKNRIVAQRGGIPNVYNTVGSYVNITFQKAQSLLGLHDVADGRPLWALVFYCLRCGGLDAAIQYLSEAGSCSELIKLLQHKKQLLKERSTQHELGDLERPHAKLEGQLKLEYCNKLRNCTDPYKKAVYAVILACDPHEQHADIVHNIEDFLWIQLSVLRSDEHTDYHGDRLTYGGLQSLILEKYGESYFNAHEKAPLYFLVLVLTGQFESAIEFLARTEKLRAHAVHMAIALNELSMLATPSNVQQPLLSAEPTDPKPMRRLNLARLIIMYAKSFEQSDTSLALQYYYMLRHFKASDGRNLMLTCVCDLLLEHSDEKMVLLIFGTPDPHEPNLYVGGIFSQFPTMEQDKYALAGMAGDELANRIQFEAALGLYIIAGQLDKGLRLLCSLLTQVVHQPMRPGGMREQLLPLTEQMDLALTRRKCDIDEQLLSMYTRLIQLRSFFDYYHAGESRKAAETLAKHHITPDSCNDVDDCISNLKQIGADVIKVMPDVLLAAMSIIYDEYKTLKSNRSSITSSNVSLALEDATRSQSHEELLQLQYLRGRAKALTNMAATLPYRMPADTNNRLVQLEILMH